MPASIVAQIYPLYVGGEFTALSKLLAPDFRISETAEAPWGGSRSGVEGAWSFWHDLHQHFDLKVQVERQFESAGGVVVVVGVLNGLSRVTGQPTAVPFLHLWTIRGALVQSLDSYLDRHELQRAFPSQAAG